MECFGKVTKFKKIEDSIHKPLYDKMHAKLNRNKNYARMLTKRRSSTVEPVLGTLINHHNMKKINSRGMPQANKHVMMAALSYNLKKFLRFVVKKPVPIAIGIARVISLKQGKDLAFLKMFIHELKKSFLSSPNFRICRYY